MIFRKADVKDIWQLVELRKKQLIDEGCYQKIKNKVTGLCHERN